jgi:hypothetical protein
MPKGPQGPILAAGIVLVLVGATRFLAQEPLLGVGCVAVGIALVGKFFWMRKSRSNA